MEMLQLTAMLVKYHHSILHDTRQDIIKFGLTYICLEDIVSKHAANVVIGYCIAHFETLAKIIQQVYISLLESSHHEGRALVTQALELIAPVLLKLCNAVPDDRNPIWVAAPRRILIEERQNVQQITTVFYFLVKHADFFYEYREKFIILIVQSLRTIAQPPNPSIESKKLVLQLMTLLWQWEQQRVEGKTFLSMEKRKVEGLGAQLITSPALSMISSTLADKSEYEFPTEARAEMISYLPEFIVSLKKPHPRLPANAKAATASHPPIPPIPSVERINSTSLLHSLLHPIDLSNIDMLLAGEPTDK